MNSAKLTTLCASACLLLGAVTLPAAAQDGSIGDGSAKRDAPALDDRAPRTPDDKSGGFGTKTCDQDVTGDGNIDLHDLLQVLLNWGPCQRIQTDAGEGLGDAPPKSGRTECKTDIRKNGRTDLDDLLQVLLNMGRTCQDVSANP